MANNKVEPQKENELNVLSDSVPCEARQETILAVLRQRYFSTSDSVLAVRLGVDKGILKRYVDRKKEELRRIDQLHLGQSQKLLWF